MGLFDRAKKKKDQEPPPGAIPQPTSRPVSRNLHQDERVRQQQLLLQQQAQQQQQQHVLREHHRDASAGNLVGLAAGGGPGGQWPAGDSTSSPRDAALGAGRRYDPSLGREAAGDWVSRRSFPWRSLGSLSGEKPAIARVEQLVGASGFPCDGAGEGEAGRGVVRRGDRRAGG